MDAKYHRIKLNSGVENGVIEIRQGNVAKLLENEPYARDACRVLVFLENHLTNGTFRALCCEAKEKLFR